MATGRLRRIIRRREREVENGADEFRTIIERMGENIGRRLAASLNTDPDKVFPKRGDDGDLIGQTEFERTLIALAPADGENMTVGEGDRLRAAILSANLEAVEQLVTAAGMGDGRAALRERVSTLAGLAEATLTAQGMPGDGIFDTVAAEALIEGFAKTNVDQVVIRTLTTNTANRIQSSLISSLATMPVSELAQTIGERESELSNSQAMTEAQTRLAMADRFLQETARKSIEDDGEFRLLSAYMGARPDGKIREFCLHLVGKAFKNKDFDQARNAQLGEHPRISGGGYRCRHYVTPVLDDDEILEDLDLVRGDMGDIKTANDAAKSKRKKKRRR